MRKLSTEQRGFAGPALLVAVAIGFVASLAVRGQDGRTVAEAMGFIDGNQTEFAATEPKRPETPPAWADED